MALECRRKPQLNCVREHECARLIATCVHFSFFLSFSFWSCELNVKQVEEFCCFFKWERAQHLLAQRDKLKQDK